MGRIVPHDWYYDGAWVLEGQSQDIHVGLGMHTIKLVVTDEDGDNASDELTITGTAEWEICLFGRAARVT